MQGGFVMKKDITGDSGIILRGLYSFSRTIPLEGFFEVPLSVQQFFVNHSATHYQKMSLPRHNPQKRSYDVSRYAWWWNRSNFPYH